MPSPVPSPPLVSAGRAAGALAGGGRFVMTDGIEHRCQVRAISSSGATLRAAVHGRPGEAVVCYLDGLGRVQGRLTRVVDGGFQVAFAASATKRERLEAHLAEPAPPDARAHERIEPLQRRAVLTSPCGRQVAVQVLNLSRTGAALNCPLPLAVGSLVSLGARPARVTRRVQRLVGLAFETAIPAEAFTPAVVL